PAVTTARARGGADAVSRVRGPALARAGRYLRDDAADAAFARAARGAQLRGERSGQIQRRAVLHDPRGGPGGRCDRDWSALAARLRDTGRHLPAGRAD